MEYSTVNVSNDEGELGPVSHVICVGLSGLLEILAFVFV